MTARGSRSDTCRRGHPWTEANTYTQPDGKRTCRRCASERRAELRAAERPAADLAPPVSRPPAWMEQALCAQVDPDLWFPDKGAAATQARKICGRCPVRQECLDYALSGADTWGGMSNGIWGGLTARQRRGQRQAGRAAA